MANSRFICLMKIFLIFLLLTSGTTDGNQEGTTGEPEAAVHKNISAVVGQTIILPYKVPDNNKPITAVYWSRPDLNPEYVFLYRDGHFGSKHLNPSYANRADLQDKEMKDGDVSLILKDVRMEDAGRYEVHVVQNGKRFTAIINLEVHPSGEKNGGGRAGMVVSLLLFLLALPLLVF